MVKIPEGEHIINSDDVGFPEDAEGPAREVHVDAFYIDQHAVTNAEFHQFVDDTGYTTDAEQYGWSFVFGNHLSEADQQYVIDSAEATPWWAAVQGASWYQPKETSSSIDDRLDHPVRYVS